MPTQPKETDIEAFLRKLHFELNPSPRKIESRLRKLMGPKRYKDYLAVTDAVHAGERPIRTTYETVKTLEEANMLMNHQSDVMCAAFPVVAAVVESGLVSGSRVVDLGCWTGALASWIGHQHPACGIVGVDRLDSLIGLAEGADHPPNVHFALWDYSLDPAPPTLGQFGLLISTFGIDFCDRGPGQQEYHSLDVTTLRNAEHEGTRSFVRSYFSKWREIAEPGAMLAAVLRIPDCETGLATIDGAADSGWTWLPGRSSFARTSKESFPCLVFRASLGPQPVTSDVECLAWWAGTEQAELRERIQREEHLSLQGAAAILAYRLLLRRDSQREGRRSYDDGHVARKEIGVAGERAYLFTRATTGYAELELVPLRNLGKLNIRF